MNNNKLSVLILTKNNEDVLEEAFLSIKDLNCKTLIIDSNSKDKTLQIAKKHQAYIYNFNENNLGKKRQYALEKASSGWVLFLDADERLTKKLIHELKTTLSKKTKYNAFLIPFANHYLGRRVRYGGENYKMLRLIKRSDALINPLLVHEKIISKSGKIGTLKTSIAHYSYRSLCQMYLKFTDYAIREARQKKLIKEKTSIRKVFLYPPHMFWARFIKDKGYKDGIFRIPLDLGFAYMELLTYITLPFIKIKK